MATTVGDIVTYLQGIAPLYLKEEWDNPGLLLGNQGDPVSSVLVTLDVMEGTVDYAIAEGISFIFSHHPLIMKGIKAIRTDSYDGRMYQKLLSHHIAVYAAHTNLDSATGGVNDVLAEHLQLQHVRPFIPGVSESLYKIAIYVPKGYGDAIREVLGKHDAGHLGAYSYCSFSVAGQGRFKPLAGTHPFIGKRDVLETVEEERIETIVEGSRLGEVITAMLAVHPYEEPAYDIYPLYQQRTALGLGRLGELPTPLSSMAAVQWVKEALHLTHVSYAGPMDRQIQTIAVLGGSGAEFIATAKAAGATLYVTGDMKYHAAQEAIKQGILVVDAGHFGTEFPVIDRMKQNIEAENEKQGWHIQCVVDPTAMDMIQRL